MKFKYYNKEKGNCVERSLSLVLNKDVDEVINDLIDIQKELHAENRNDIEVFEYILHENDFIDDNSYNGKIINECSFAKGTYVIFCFDQKDFYHMNIIIDNCLYDKNEDNKKLYIIKTYKSIDK